MARTLEGSAINHIREEAKSLAGDIESVAQRCADDPHGRIPYTSHPRDILIGKLVVLLERLELLEAKVAGLTVTMTPFRESDRESDETPISEEKIPIDDFRPKPAESKTTGKKTAKRKVAKKKSR
jgi:hypothetical protein